MRNVYGINQTDPRSTHLATGPRTRFRSIRSEISYDRSRRESCPSRKHSITPLYMYHSQNPTGTWHWREMRVIGTLAFVRGRVHWGRRENGGVQDRSGILHRDDPSQPHVAQTPPRRGRIRPAENGETGIRSLRTGHLVTRRRSLDSWSLRKFAVSADYRNAPEHPRARRPFAGKGREGRWNNESRYAYKRKRREREKNKAQKNRKREMNR